MPRSKVTPLNSAVDRTVKKVGKDVKKVEQGVKRNVTKTTRTVRTAQDRASSSVRTAQARATTQANKSGNDVFKAVQGFVKTFPVQDLERAMAGIEKSVSSLNEEIQKVVTRIGHSVRGTTPRSTPTKSVATDVPAPRKRGRPVGSGKKKVAGSVTTTRKPRTTGRATTTTMRSTSVSTRPTVNAVTSVVAAEPKRRGRKPGVKVVTKAVSTEPKRRGRKPGVKSSTSVGARTPRKQVVAKIVRKQPAPVVLVAKREDSPVVVVS